MTNHEPQIPSPSPEQPDQPDHRIRNMVAVGAIPMAAVGLVFTGAYLGHDTDLFGVPGQAAHEANGAPHPSEIPASATKVTIKPAGRSTEASHIPVKSEIDRTIEAKFQKSAIATAIKIAEDAANPRSLSESYDGTAVGNKRLEIAQGKTNVGGFPEIFIDYDTKTRQVGVRSLTIVNPSARVEKENFQGIDLQFQALGAEANNLDRKRAAGQQLEARDYIAFFRSGNVDALQVGVTHNSAEPTYMSLNERCDAYEYKAANASDAIPIKDENYGIMERMGRDVELTELELRQGLNK